MSGPRCQECGCTCNEGAKRLENDGLTKGIAVLNKRLTESEEQRIRLEEQLSEERLANERKVEECCARLEESEEQLARLKQSYDDVVKKSQEMENRILQLGKELEDEKRHSDEVLAAMTERLMDTTDNMNKMEKETAQNRKDCNLVVQLLKCNQSLDKNFVTRKVNTFPHDLKSKLSKELDLEPTIEQHPPWGKKRWQRSKSSASYPSTETLNSSRKMQRAKSVGARSGDYTTDQELQTTTEDK